MNIGILTSGGDCPGLNAAIRGVARSAIDQYGMRVIGFRDGFRGLVNNRSIDLDLHQLSGILTNGGTMLGTSRDKPHRMPVGGKTQNMIDVAMENYRRHRLDALVCIGGGGTQKNALRLAEAGMRILTLPKTIDNDVVETDFSFGFDTAMGIATEAIDRLHSTAMSHGRIIVVEVMGHRAGWLALGAGIAGGADVILIPEVPYDEAKVAATIQRRTREGKNFSIVVVAEGAMSIQQSREIARLEKAKEKAKDKTAKSRANAHLQEFYDAHLNHTLELTKTLERLTGLESRLTILGHLQRGGTPSSADRLLATRLGTACAKALKQGKDGVMVAARGDETRLVNLDKVAGPIKLVPIDHPWISAARAVSTGFGD